VNGIGALVLAAAAGFNPWLTLLIAAGLALYSQHATLTPSASAVVERLGNWLLLVLAVLLGLDVVLGKVPRFTRTTERISGPVSALAGAALCLAMPNALLGWAWPLAALAGALIAAGFRLLRRWAALALTKPLGRYRFGYVAASIATNLVAAILSALTFAVSR
jgi:hypothetical protein